MSESIRLLEELIIERDFGRDVTFIFRPTVNGGCVVLQYIPMLFSLSSFSFLIFSNFHFLLLFPFFRFFQRVY